MCKVLMIPKITDKTRAGATKFMKRMMPLMSSGNTDGLGYTATDKAGNIFGERWHQNVDAYTSAPAAIPEAVEEAMAGMYSGSWIYGKEKGEHNSFGNIKMDEMTALTMHTRYATSGKEFSNTHPFVYDDKDTSLIHNGVIRNTEDFKFKVSSCDSESILIAYLDKKVNLDPKATLNAMSGSLVGYYACGVFSRDAEGNRILDVFKGDSASLGAAYVVELETLVFSTSLKDIEEACGILGYKISKSYQLKEGVFFRYNAEGLLTTRLVFEPSKTFRPINHENTRSYAGRGSGYNKNHGTEDEGGTIIDATKGPSANLSRKNKNLSPEVMTMMKLPPGVSRLHGYKPEAKA